MVGGALLGLLVWPAGRATAVPDGQTLIAKGTSALKARKYKAAVEYLSKGIAVSGPPQESLQELYADAWLSRSRAHTKLANFDLALEDLESILSMAKETFGSSHVSFVLVLH